MWNISTVYYGIGTRRHYWFQKQWVLLIVREILNFTLLNIAEEEEAIEGIHLRQQFQLASACGTPKYTNFTAGFADCLDYIYYEKTKLSVEQVIPLPTNEELTQNTALPSIVFPSDHISLVADLKFL